MAQIKPTANYDAQPATAIWSTTSPLSSFLSTSAITPSAIMPRPRRGRRQDNSLPYNRARDAQRAFRARRTAHLEQVEQRVVDLEEENEKLRLALGIEPASREPLGKGPTGLDKTLPVEPSTKCPTIKSEPEDSESERRHESPSTSSLSTKSPSPLSPTPGRSRWALDDGTIVGKLPPPSRPAPFDYTALGREEEDVDGCFDDGEGSPMLSATPEPIPSPILLPSRPRTLPDVLPSVVSTESSLHLSHSYTAQTRRAQDAPAGRPVEGVHDGRPPISRIPTPPIISQAGQSYYHTASPVSTLSRLGSAGSLASWNGEPSQSPAVPVSRLRSHSETMQYMRYDTLPSFSTDTRSAADHHHQSSQHQHASMSIVPMPQPPPFSVSFDASITSSHQRIMGYQDQRGQYFDMGQYCVGGT